MNPMQSPNTGVGRKLSGAERELHGGGRLTINQLHNAQLWADKHSKHLRSIMVGLIMPCRLSIEDSNRPDLWKPNHWLWVIENYNILI